MPAGGQAIYGSKEHFESLMTEAQQLHADSKYDEAIPLWGEATSIAPNESEEARALRGSGSSNERLGNFVVAIERYESAWEIHDNLVEDALDTAKDNVHELRAARAESARTLGRAIVNQAVRNERQGLHINDIRHEVFHAIELFDQADYDVNIYRIRTGVTHQHERNLRSYRSVAESLYGYRKEGRREAFHALRLAPGTESRRNPTSADLSWKQRMSRKLVYTVRGVAALGINLLSTEKPSRRRKVALWTYQKVA